MRDYKPSRQPRIIVVKTTESKRAIFKRLVSKVLEERRKQGVFPYDKVE